MTKKEVLYVCMSNDRSKDMFLLRKQDVEKSIKSMEEDPDSDLEYNVLGSVDINHPKTPYLLTYKINKADDLLYDVVYADDSFEAHLALVRKPRLKGTSAKITNTLNLIKLIEEYYD
jgi:hypothetical protein